MKQSGRFHHTTTHCSELLLMDIILLYIRFHEAKMLFVSLAGHGWSHRSFLFSFVFDNFSIFLVIRIDKVNPSQLSSIVKLQFLFCPSLLFSILSCLTNSRPNFWPYIILSGSRLNLCQSHTGPHVSFGEGGGFSSKSVNLPDLHRRLLVDHQLKLLVPHVSRHHRCRGLPLPRHLSHSLQSSPTLYKEEFHSSK